MARTSSPIPLRSPSPHTLLTTLSDPLHLRQSAGLRRSQSADQQPQQERPSSSTSSLPLPTNPSPGARSPSRRKLPAIPAGAANAKFPSVIRITRAQLQQVMKLPSLFPLKQTSLYSASSLSTSVATHLFYIFFFLGFRLLLCCWLLLFFLCVPLGLACLCSSLSQIYVEGALCRTDRAWVQMCPCHVISRVCLCLTVACLMGNVES